MEKRAPAVPGTWGGYPPSKIFLLLRRGPDRSGGVAKIFCYSAGESIFENIAGRGLRLAAGAGLRVALGGPQAGRASLWSAILSA